MAKSAKQYLDEILKWPDAGGFQPGRLADVLAEFDARIERLENAHPKMLHGPTCSVCRPGSPCIMHAQLPESMRPEPGPDHL